MDFFTQLEADNSREFWQANRAVYDTSLRPHFEAIVADIAGFPAWRVYRPHNDTRFQNAKGPYKTFIGAVSERADGVGAFVQISKRGLLVGTGLPMPAADQLPKLRNAIAADVSGAQFRDCVAQVRATGAAVHGGRWEPLKRTPKPFANDHPRAEYLRWKGLEINYRPHTVEWAEPADAAAAITQLIDQAEPLHRWIARHVGPSSLTLEERFAPKRKA
jgi:uncharacterized protein (TIGR02453 family)